MVCRFGRAVARARRYVNLPRFRFLGKPKYVPSKARMVWC